MNEDVMINWNKSKAGRWTNGGDPPGLYTTCLKQQQSRRGRDIWMVQQRSDVRPQVSAHYYSLHNAAGQSDGTTLGQ